MAHGLPGSTPAAAIANGTLPEQEIVRGTLADLPLQLDAAALPSPVMIVIGKVVAVMDELALSGVPELALEQVGHA
jgi:siroheme synthase